MARRAAVATVDDVAEHPEPFTDASGQALDRATDRLVDALRGYVEQVRAMRGGTAEMPVLFERADALMAVVRRWDEVAMDHSGTAPIWLHPGAWDDDPVEDGEGEEDEPEPAAQLSVVSRWDLDLVDPEALVVAGRQAHRRNQPDESEEDAVVAVHRPAVALYALLHEAGELWYDLPGVQVRSGARVYVEPAVPLGRPGDGDGDGDVRGSVALVDGDVGFSESWG